MDVVFMGSDTVITSAVGANIGASARQKVQKKEQNQTVGRSCGGRNTKTHALAVAKPRLPLSRSG
jgi:hypothetical protein